MLYIEKKSVRDMAAGTGWSTRETEALIEVWGNANVQSKLDGVQRNRAIFEKIAAELEKMGYEKTWMQCRTKIKNLTQQYRKVSRDLVVFWLSA